jgi:hypothetical protein
VLKPPAPPALPSVAWINKPQEGYPKATPGQYFYEDVVSYSLTRAASVASVVTSPSKDRYEDSLVPRGSFTVTPEEALDARVGST